MEVYVMTGYYTHATAADVMVLAVFCNKPTEEQQREAVKSFAGRTGLPVEDLVVEVSGEHSIEDFGAV